MLFVITGVMFNLKNIISIYSDEIENKEVFNLAWSNLRAYSMIFFLDGI